MLDAKNVRLDYPGTVAVADATATVDAGELVAVTGPSGAGKSSLLYCMAGLVPPSSGRVEFDGRDLTEMTDDERSDVRRAHFGFVFQFAELVPELTIRENIGLPLELLGKRRRARRARVDELLERLGLQEHANRRPDKVSGGQAQRAAVARAISHEPDVVFADEPTGALDSRNGTVVIDALLELAHEHHTAILLVTHADDVAGRAGRRIVMHDGSVSAEHERGGT